MPAPLNQWEEHARGPEVAALCRVAAAGRPVRTWKDRDGLIRSAWVLTVAHGRLYVQSWGYWPCVYEVPADVDIADELDQLARRDQLYNADALLSSCCVVLS